MRLGIAAWAALLALSLGTCIWGPDRFYRAPWAILFVCCYAPMIWVRFARPR